MSKTQGNDQVIFNATNAQNMPNTIQLASREQSVHTQNPIHIQDQVLTQTQVHGYERENKLSTEIIDELALRVFCPRDPNADVMSVTEEPFRSTISYSINQDKATRIQDWTTNTQGLPSLSIAFSPSLSTILQCHLTLFGYILFRFYYPDKNTAYNPNTVMEGYGMFPKGPEIAGARGIMSTMILINNFLNDLATISFMII